MNREIKFRVRDFSTKKLIGYERINTNGHFENIRLNRTSWLLGCITQEDNLLREQYTGLTDKGTNEIYEGDIVKWDDNSKGEYWRVAIVEMYPNLRLRIIQNTLHKLSARKDDIFNWGSFAYGGDHLLVVGNIYENANIIIAELTAEQKQERFEKRMRELPEPIKNHNKPIIEKYVMEFDEEEWNACIATTLKALEEK